MRNRQRTNLILSAILAFLVIGSIGQRVIENQNQTAAQERKDFVAPFASEEITRIDIIRESVRYNLTKADTGFWYLESGDEEPVEADRDRILRLLKTVDEATVLSVVSTDNTADAEYGLDDESQIHLSAFRGDELVFDLLIGDQAGNTDTFYARHVGEDGVVILNGPRQTIARRSWEFTPDSEGDESG